MLERHVHLANSLLSFFFFGDTEIPVFINLDQIAARPPDTFFTAYLLYFPFFYYFFLIQSRPEQWLFCSLFSVKTFALFFCSNHT